MTDAKESNSQVRDPLGLGRPFNRVGNGHYIQRIPVVMRTSYQSQISQTIDEFLVVPKEQPSEENPKAYFKILKLNISRFFRLKIEYKKISAFSKSKNGSQMNLLGLNTVQHVIFTKTYKKYESHNKRLIFTADIS